MAPMNDSQRSLCEQATERARENFSSGYNCGECVVEAVLATIETDLPPHVWKLATGFGGGIGLSGDTCGALIGAVLAVGAVHGRSRLPGGDDRRDVLRKSKAQLYDDPGLYRLFNQIPTWFRQQFGHTLCRELTARWHDDWLCRDHALHCREIIAETAGQAATWMCFPPDRIGTLAYGDTVERLDS